MSASNPAATNAPPEAPGADRGLYCSTSGTYFTDKEALTAHYKSDFHRYNLKRKVAGLPPVTREWYDARAAALKASLAGGGGAGAARGGAATSSSSSSASLVGATRVWQDPLTKKKFTSEATYRTFVSSKKYRDLVKKKAGGVAPEAVVIVHSLEGGGGGGGGGGGSGVTTRAAAAARAQGGGAGGGGAGGGGAASSATAAAAGAFRVAAPNGVTFSAGNDMEVEEEEEEKDGDGDNDDSEWETASDDEEDKDIEPWDPTVSLFDNRKFDTVEGCLEHMWKKFGFYIPDVAHCRDPSGLLCYLGMKLRSGLVPLYSRGDDVSGKTFHSLHAVQRHMVDLNNCRVCWEGNEDEYAEWYEWSDDDDDDDDDDEMSCSDDDDDDDGVGGVGGAGSKNEEAFELALPNGKVIGARAFARFYKQSSHRPLSSRDDDDGKKRRPLLALAGAGAAARATRGSTSLALAATEQQRQAIVARYRAMGVKEADVPAAAKKERRARKAAQRHRAREQLRASMAANINNNLPKNVPY